MVVFFLGRITAQIIAEAGQLIGSDDQVVVVMRDNSPTSTGDSRTCEGWSSAGGL